MKKRTKIHAKVTARMAELVSYRDLTESASVLHSIKVSLSDQKGFVFNHFHSDGFSHACC